MTLLQPVAFLIAVLVCVFAFYALYRDYQSLKPDEKSNVKHVDFGTESGKSVPKQYIYGARSIMSPNEREFFDRMRRAVPGLFFFPQVAMSALIEPVNKSGYKYNPAFEKIAKKRVDWAIYSADMRLLCVVELDDRTHDKEKDDERDRMLSSAGISTVRWESRSKPDEEAIRLKLGEFQPEI